MAIDDPQLSAEFFENVIEQAFTLWVEPEQRHRGSEPRREDVWAALVELPPGRPPVVTLNEEVRAVAKAVDGAAVPAGTPLSKQNVELVDQMIPTGIDEDSGWLFFAVAADTLFLSSDFRYNKRHARNLLELAEEFWRAATDGYASAERPAIDNLLSAAELTVHAMMLGEVQITKDHGRRLNWLKQNTGIGNQPRAHFSSLKRLSKQRDAARYGDGTVTIDGGEFSELAGVIADMIEHARDSTGT